MPHKGEPFGSVRAVLWRRESRPALALATVGATAIIALPAGTGVGATGQVSALRGQQATYAARARGALLGLYALDSRLARVRSQLASLRAQAAQVERDRARVAHERAVARSVLRLSQERLANRLRSLYEEGTPPDAIAILLGSASLNDALSRLDDLERTAVLDHQAVTDSKAARARLASLDAQLASRAAELDALQIQATRTVASLAAARAARVGYLASLRAAQRLKARQIAQLSAAAHSGVQRSSAIEAQSSAPIAPAAGAPAGSTLTVTATGYSLGGTTSTGLPVGWGVAAVDPSVIPLGTRLSIPGYGEAVASDTGTAVQGATVDLWFPTEAQALAWGRRVVTVTLH
jgi:3D (Asp-Asp-Asp) domain-containing protein